MKFVTIPAVLFAVAFAVLAFAPAVSAVQTPDMMCAMRYWEEDVGPVTVVSPNSCRYYVQPNEEYATVDLTVGDAGVDQCVDAVEAGYVYSFSTYWVVACDDAARDHLNAGKTTVRAPADATWREAFPMYCMSRYSETDFGAFSVVSRSSCHYDVEF